VDAKVPKSSSLDAIQTIAEVDIVQVHVEDFFLRVLLFQPIGDDNLLDLSRNGDVCVVKNCLACKLLRERAGTSYALSEQWIDEQARNDAADVDGSVAENRSSSDAMRLLMVISEISVRDFGRRFSVKYTEDSKLSLRSNTCDAFGVSINSDPAGGTWVE